MRLIDADSLTTTTVGICDANGNSYGCAEVVFAEDLEKASTIDAEPVRHGKWLDEKTGEPVPFDSEGCPTRSCRCSVCGEWLTASDEYPVTGKYCPNCGVNMDYDSLKKGRDVFAKEIDKMQKKSGQQSHTEMVMLDDGNFVPKEICTFTNPLTSGGKSRIDDVDLPCECQDNCDHCIIQRVFNEYAALIGGQVFTKEEYRKK